VPELDKPLIAEQRNDELKVSVLSVPEITLNDRARKSLPVFNNPLSAFPPAPRRGIVAPPMPEILALEDDRLEGLVVQSRNRPANDF
jgi:hypothetical protein